MNTPSGTRLGIRPKHHYANSPYWSLYILLRTSWENLLKHQDSSSLVIIFLILMTCMGYKALIS